MLCSSRHIWASSHLIVRREGRTRLWIGCLTSSAWAASNTAALLIVVCTPLIVLWPSSLLHWQSSFNMLQALAFGQQGYHLPSSSFSLFSSSFYSCSHFSSFFFAVFFFPLLLPLLFLLFSFSSIFLLLLLFCVCPFFPCFCTFFVLFLFNVLHHYFISLSPSLSSSFSSLPLILRRRHLRYNDDIHACLCLRPRIPLGLIADDSIPCTAGGVG